MLSQRPKGLEDSLPLAGVRADPADALRGLQGDIGERGDFSNRDQQIHRSTSLRKNNSKIVTSRCRLHAVSGEHVARVSSTTILAFGRNRGISKTLKPASGFAQFSALAAAP